MLVIFVFSFLENLSTRDHLFSFTADVAITVRTGAVSLLILVTGHIPNWGEGVFDRDLRLATSVSRSSGLLYS